MPSLLRCARNDGSARKTARLAPCARQARAEQRVERLDDGQSLLAVLQAFVQPCRRGGLKAHIAVMARPEPGAVQRGAGRLIKVCRALVDLRIAPGVRMAGL